MKVLLVEDYQELRTLLATFLRRRGHQIVAAGAATEALDRVAAFMPDLAIVDYRLPDMDGVELGRQIQQRSPGTRVVVCSASDPEEFEAAQELTQAGFTYVDKATLPAALESVMG